MGKTTTAVNLAYFLAKDKKLRTLLVDFDPQGNATSGLGIDKTEILEKTWPTILEVVSGAVTMKDAVRETKWKNLSIVPTTPRLADAETGLATAERKFQRLRDAILSVSSDFDVILIDLPPSLSLLTVNGLVAAQQVLLPVQAEFYAMEGLGQLLETMSLVRKGLNPTLNLLGVLITMMNSRTTLSQQVQQEIEKHFTGKVFNTTIPRNVRLAEAPSFGVPVGAYDRFSKGSRAYKNLTTEVCKRLNIAKP